MRLSKFDYLPSKVSVCYLALPYQAIYVLSRYEIRAIAKQGRAYC